MSTTVKVAKIFMIIGVIAGFCAFIVPGIIALIVRGQAMKAIKEGRKPSTVVCVLTLIFCNIIAGICLLVSHDSDYAQVAA